MNAELRREVTTLLTKESAPEVAAQALNDYWWFHHGQPGELTEILTTVIQFYGLKEIDHALDAYTRSTRPDRQGQQKGLPFEGDWDRDEWATEEVRAGGHPLRPGPGRV